ncbi:MAG: hypothetical protein LBM92_07815 [Opitutaceae bacterium]|jgi:hypothetical protein|nr:hypothetical protein [Opitutaceae bacterium]
MTRPARGGFLASPRDGRPKNRPEMMLALAIAEGFDQLGDIFLRYYELPQSNLLHP